MNASGTMMLILCEYLVCPLRLLLCLMGLKRDCCLIINAMPSVQVVQLRALLIDHRGTVHVCSIIVLVVFAYDTRCDGMSSRTVTQVFC